MPNQIKPTNNQSLNTNIIDKRISEAKKAQQMSFNLLVKQLQYQDIDNPVDTNQLTQNLFQMNQLEALTSIDYKLDSIAADINKNATLLTASNMIGKLAVTKGESIMIDSESSEIPISYIVDSNGQNVNATIKLLDANGRLVYEERLENIKGNVKQNFVLKVKDQDDKLTVPEGVYTIQFLADTQDQNAVSTELWVTNKIQQAMMDGHFVTSNGEQITSDDILAIQEKPLVAAVDYKPSKKGISSQSIADIYALQKGGTAA